MKTCFFSLASGSSGNCYFLGSEEYGILIDAGVGIRTIKKVLKERNIDLDKIIGILVTHDHADHIKTVGCLGEKHCIPVYTTEKVHSGIDRSRYVEETLYMSRRIIEKDVPFFIKDFTITAFDVPHDSTDNVGYFIEFENHKFTLATDIGCITDTIIKYARKANHLVIEANYDEEMLQFGTYPAFLKERITSATGHLSNRETADFLAKIYHANLHNIWLCHLSRDNNHPELAFKTIDIRLFREGIRVGKDVNIITLKRTHPSDVYFFE